MHTSDGHGLARDARVLQHQLIKQGYDEKSIHVVVYSPRKRGKLKKVLWLALFKFNGIFFLKKWQRVWWKQADTLYIHLENIIPDILLKAGKHVLIPNQEWFRPTGLALLPYMDAVWCKSQLAQRIFSEFTARTQLIKFVSVPEDFQTLRAQPKQQAFLSRIGNSRLRGLEQILASWWRHPEWPEVHIVLPAEREIHPCPPNVKYVSEFPDAKDYLSFAATFKFHIFATQAEGFGHSIFEAINLGAVVLITNAPPMNEWLGWQQAILIDATYNGQHRLSPLFLVREEQLENAVNRALGLDWSDTECFQQSGYELLKLMAGDFDAALEKALNELNFQPPKKIPL